MSLGGNMVPTKRYLVPGAIAAILILHTVGPIGHAQGTRVLLTGTIKSAAGANMEGVTVSARGVGKTFTTTVFTDAAGEFYFPQLDAGKYKVWTQAVGFDPGILDLDVTGAVHRQDFTMRPM